MTGCPNREEIKAYSWLNNGIPADLCEKYPELKGRGFYRRLDDDPKTGKPRYQFLSFCSPIARKMIAFYDLDLDELLKGNLPKKVTPK